ncbi:N-acetylglucosaminyl-diphospho-decaprenol L-rhamnosyltransferase [Rubripirellula tenax]|uniref:N-acetylglucosaminyl-diphospho-decaprenol L-rhamnosyltransferase n=1 Tax=Rubripirellula tenax TaxID=2528015 RepID=A0A5C6F9P0_9BACT|nr:glycosyltransferase family 2 protein [Rubripirellula tenax]TWU56876.1 N-acetylglucosaminyl-diphospho-decaprenol L-rhamnosyltransferase [Rubripirellula tenax]
MNTSIVIVNYRTAPLTCDCLASLATHVVGRSDVHVALVDNASGDDSVDVLRAAIEANGWQSWVTLMPLDRNGGFAFGNNAAIRDVLAVTSDDAGGRSKTDLVWLLNPDTLVREGALEHMIAYLDANPEVGIVGSRLEDRDGTAQRSAFRFPSLASEIDDGLRLGIVSRLFSKKIIAPPISESAIRTDWVCGASMLIRREVFEAISVLDENYFMYYEETDFCRQAALAGWACGYEPRSRVVHLVGQASGVQIQSKPQKRRPQYWFESRRRYFVKNHGFLFTCVTDLAWGACYSLYRIRAAVQRKTVTDPPCFLFDFFRNSAIVRGGAM